ncbi:MAG: transglutaminase domain-containing protein [Rickettsiales bacterium]
MKDHIFKYNFKIFFVYFAVIFFLNITNLKAEIKITNWSEISKINNNGRQSDFKITIQVVNIPENSGISSFIISSSAPRNFQVEGVKINGVEAKYNIKDGQTIEFIFDKILTNNQSAEIQFREKVIYEKVSKYLRQEQVYIPNFANGAKAKVIIDIGEDFELISSHPNLKQYNNYIIFDGVISQNGYLEMLKLTNSGGVWDVRIKSKILLNNSKGILEITVPYLFRGGAQKVEKQFIGANVIPKSHLTTKDNDIMTFETNPEMKQIDIFHQANIYTGKKYRLENLRSPQNYLEISENDKILLKPLLEFALNSPENKDLPDYVKILKFVHQYIKYDLSFYAKLLNVEQIIQSKAGVCSEFATLFNAMARLAQIPSSVVHGFALGEYDKFESHAWNMIYINNKWIHVDPTWNLSKGIVSSSHIYLKDNRKEDILIKYRGQNSEINIDKEYTIKEINN